MRTRCVRQGQMEIGIVEHEGRDFSALGATVVGNDITGYTRLRDGEISLTTWSGQTVMAYRSKVVATYWDGSLALSSAFLVAGSSPVMPSAATGCCLGASFWTPAPPKRQRLPLLLRPTMVRAGCRGRRGGSR